VNLTWNQVSTLLCYPGLDKGEEAAFVKKPMAAMNAFLPIG
jgi:hypothetical protein